MKRERKGERKKEEQLKGEKSLWDYIHRNRGVGGRKKGEKGKREIRNKRVNRRSRGDEGTNHKYKAIWYEDEEAEKEQ